MAESPIVVACSFNRAQISALEPPRLKDGIPQQNVAGRKYERLKLPFTSMDSRKAAKPIPTCYDDHSAQLLMGGDVFGTSRLARIAASNRLLFVDHAGPAAGLRFYRVRQE